MSTDYAYDDEADHDEEISQEPDDVDHEPDHWQEYKDEQMMGPPQEEPDEEPPLTLEEIQAAYDDSAGAIWALSASARTVAVGLLQLIKEARAADAELDRMRATTRHEYTVTDGAPPADDAELVTGEQASLVLHNNTAKAVWLRAVHAAHWDQLSAEPPF